MCVRRPNLCFVQCLPRPVSPILDDVVENINSLFKGWHPCN